MSIGKRSGFCAAAILLLLVMFSGAALAAPAGSFTRVEGSVDILRATESAAVQARAGDAVSMGDAIRTKRNGKAEVQFQDGTVIQLAPETRITIDEYSFGATGARERGFLSLLRGKLRAVVSKFKGTVVPASKTDSGFSVKTPTAIAGVRGTDFIVYYERGISGIIFLEGVGFAYNPSQPDRVVIIKGGQAAFVTGSGDPPTDAQDVSGSFVAPHLKDTTVALTSSEGGAAEGGALGTIQVNVIDPNFIQLPEKIDQTPKDIGPTFVVPTRPDTPVIPPNVNLTTPVKVNVPLP